MIYCRFSPVWQNIINTVQIKSSSSMIYQGLENCLEVFPFCKYLLSLQILKGIKDCYFGTFALDLFDHPIWTIKKSLKLSIIVVTQVYLDLFWHANYFWLWPKKYDNKQGKTQTVQVTTEKYGMLPSNCCSVSSIQIVPSLTRDSKDVFLIPWMIVQNFSKWTTTQEISKMLMEIQGTET